MQCPHCRHQIKIHREFCPGCGKRIEFKFEEVARSAIDQSAVHRTREFEDKLRWAIILGGLALAILLGLNDLWDGKLIYSGAHLPMISSPQAGESSSIRILGSRRELERLPHFPPQPPRTFQYRRQPLRMELTTANGGHPDTVKAVQKGLAFLQKMQNKDGSWSVSTTDLHIPKALDESPNFQWAKVGITGLAVLAFLGEGEDWLPNEKGMTGPYANTLKNAISFLMKSQDAVNGRFGEPEGNFMYNHGLATLALCEAAGLSGDQSNRQVAQKAIDLLQRIQGKQGAWGYRDVLGAREDSSVSAWQVQALLAAQEAGLQVDAEVLKRSLEFYEKATDDLTGTVAYDFKDNFVRPGLFGVALMLRQQLGESNDSREIKLLVKRAMEGVPTSGKGWGNGWKSGKDEVSDTERSRTFDPYRWFFTTYGLFFYGGEPWETWNKKVSESLVDLQDSDGAWRANDIWSVKMGSVYSTSLSVLTLQVYYRVQ